MQMFPVIKFLLRISVVGICGCLSQCSSRVTLTEHHDVILSPGYPNGYAEDETCRWRIQSDLDEFIVLVSIKELVMSYDDNSTQICTGILKIKGSVQDCQSENQRCISLVSSDNCTEHLNRNSVCSVKSLSTNRFDIRFDSYVGMNSSDQRFKLEYKIIDCKQGIATTIGNTTNRNITTPAPNETVTESMVKSSQALPVLPAVLVPLILLILVATLLVLYFVRRSRRSTTTAVRENSYYEVTSDKSKPQNSSDVARYQEWQPKTESPPKQLDIDGKGESFASTAPARNVYEDIGGVNHCALSTQYSFADTETDEKYAIASNFPDNSLYSGYDNDEMIPGGSGDPYEMPINQSHEVRGAYDAADISHSRLNRQQSENPYCEANEYPHLFLNTNGKSPQS